VDHVINYGIPEKIDEYVHRIGRTARAGNPGRATSFYDASKDSALAADLVTVLTEAGQDVPEFLKNSGGSFGGMDDWANGETAKTTGQEEDW